MPQKITHIEDAQHEAKRDSLLKAAVFGFLLNGFVITLCAAGVVAFEAAAQPGGMTMQSWLSVSAAAFVVCHLALEARSRARFSLVRWIVFFACLVEFVGASIQAGQFGADRILLGVTALWGGLHLLGARVCIKNARLLNAKNSVVQVLVLLVGWHVEVLFVVGAIVSPFI